MRALNENCSQIVDGARVKIQLSMEALLVGWVLQYDPSHLHENEYHLQIGEL